LNRGRRWKTNNYLQGQALGDFESVFLAAPFALEDGVALQIDGVHSAQATQVDEGHRCPSNFGSLTFYPAHPHAARKLKLTFKVNLKFKVRQEKNVNKLNRSVYRFGHSKTEVFNKYRFILFSTAGVAVDNRLSRN
jgi:hypothetical protein